MAGGVWTGALGHLEGDLCLGGSPGLGVLLQVHSWLFHEFALAGGEDLHRDRARRWRLCRWDGDLLIDKRYLHWRCGDVWGSDVIPSRNHNAGVSADVVCAFSELVVGKLLDGTPFLS